MRVIVHDFVGHPGQVSLSRELARRGHTVEHQFCSSYVTGQGATHRRADDPAGFTVIPLSVRGAFVRYSPLVRIGQELHYAARAARALTSAKPDVVVLSNVPLVTLWLVTRILRIRRLPYVFWQQDVCSVAIALVARQRLGRLGALVGGLAERLERNVARGAAAVLPIAENFTERLTAWRVPPAHVHVVPNWAAIDELPLRPRDNAWARAHGLTDTPVLLYAGTLGLKHDPSLLTALAEGLGSDTRVVVVSEGRGRELLEQAKAERGLDSLLLIDFQPYEALPDVLGSADILLAVLESDASRYSVPSKVLSYLCAGRAIVAALPDDNAAAQSIRDAGAGVVAPPGNATVAIAAVQRLLDDPNERNRCGRSARAYAETTFDIRAIGERIERLLVEISHP